jgi:hypothetical protein
MQKPQYLESFSDVKALFFFDTLACCSMLSRIVEPRSLGQAGSESRGLLTRYAACLAALLTDAKCLCVYFGPVRKKGILGTPGTRDRAGAMATAKMPRRPHHF